MNKIYLWYDGEAEGAAQFYAKTIPDSSVGEVHHAQGDYPSWKEGRCVDGIVYRDGNSDAIHARSFFRSCSVRLVIGKFKQVLKADLVFVFTSCYCAI